MRIGLLGGSFNPAHDGHRFITEAALARLELDCVWWLVSPGNPLKPRQGMAPFEQRLASARAIAAGHPDIVVSDIEARLGTRFTAHTLEALAGRFPRTRFVWLMGADNLAQLRDWKDWTRIFHLVPVAVFDRPSYSLNMISSLAARRFQRHRVRGGLSRSLAHQSPPAWSVYRIPRHAASSTAIRAARQWLV